MRSQNNKNITRRLVFDALLTAIALIIFLVEAQFPPIVPVPGVKLGLANMMTVYAMFELGPKDTFAIMLCRIILGSILGGQFISFLFSLSGGICCYLTMLVMRKLLAENQIWVCGIIGALAHNIGQMIAAMIIMKTRMVFVYFLILAVSGIITGFFTGMSAQLIIRHIHKVTNHNKFHKEVM